MIAIKRAYDPPARNDGTRYLVDRLWPRGVKREALDVEAWTKDVAPSAPLRKWFGHDPEKWDEFRRRYTRELDENPEAWKPLLNAARKGKVTLVYGAKDTEHNDAVVLRDYLQKHMKR